MAQAPEELSEEPQPPRGHVRVVYLGPVAPHWQVVSDFGDRNVIEELRDLGASEVRSCRSWLQLTCLHLLKMTAWPDESRAIDPTHWQQSGVRNSPQLLGQIETSVKGTLREKVFSSYLTYLRRNSRRSLGSMFRAVITLTKPPDKRRNTTKASRPSSVWPKAMYRFWRVRLIL